jgi:hypothetical protein
MRSIARGLVCVLGVCVAAGPSAAQPEVIAPSFTSLEPGGDAEDTYQKNSLGVIHYRVRSLSPLTLVFGGSWWRPYRGRYRLSMTYRQFFEQLGRPDLADRSDRRRVVGGTVLWGGIAVQLVGIYLAITGFNDSPPTRAWVGLGMFGGGMIASAIGAEVEKPPLDEAEAAALASGYNQLLRGHLQRGPGLVLRPSLGPGRAGVMARASW